MASIAVLDPIVSNKIAAGEVVERPASVIKELVENAIDADAKSITVEIKQGGISYMRVTDNGSGIRAEEAETAFLRHATSKIKEAEDLDGILSLGFRGEALASIASVSKVTLITKTTEATDGCSVTVEGGIVTENNRISCPNGTTIMVRNLFYNTPARMKFLKKDSTEASHIIDMVQRIALGHPEISFRMISNEKENFFTPGDNDLMHAVYAVYGRDYAKEMILVEYETDTIKITGLIGKPTLSRPNRTFQTFFVNKRCVVNRTLHFALSESYKNRMMVGRFPIAVLSLWLNPKSVDVNVHPAKTEIKFQNERAVYDCVYWACKNALHKMEDTPVLIPEEKHRRAIDRTVVPTESFVQAKMNPESLKPMPKASIFQKAEVMPQEKPAEKREYPKPQVNETFRLLEKEEPTYKIEKELPSVSHEEKEEQKEAAPVERQNVRVVGQVFDSYIVAEKDGVMLMIDQHAAHERLNFEALLKKFRERNVDMQMMFVPVPVRCSKAEKDIFEENRDFFSRLGFESEIEESGILLRSVPMGMNAENVEDTVLEMLQLLKDGNKNISLEIEEKAIFSVSCKSAIKANHYLTKEEQQKLVEDVLALEGINSCPHGRPITLSMTKYQIEKQFKRV